MDSCFPPVGGLEGARRLPGPDHRVLQDLDLFYIKQIAHSLQEVELEQKIEVELKMREGTTRLLAACRHQAQALEAAKSLLTSNERMSAYMAALHQRKRAATAAPPPQDHPRKSSGAESCPPCSPCSPCQGRLSLSDLRMPLIWRDTDHFKNKGDYRRFAVFVLARVGTQLLDSSLLYPVDRALTDLHFPDVLTFGPLPPDFSLSLHVYSHMLRDDMSIASTPRKIKNTIHTSISKTVGKKLAASLRDELNSGKIGPHFELMASAQLCLDHVHPDVRTHDLTIHHTEGRGGGLSEQLPLFGHFCCRLAAQPDCLAERGERGERSEGGDESGWAGAVTMADRPEVGWAALHAFTLSTWPSRELWLRAPDSQPLSSHPVNRDSVVKTRKRRQSQSEGGGGVLYELCLGNEVEGRPEWVTLVLPSSGALGEAATALRRAVADSAAWRHAADSSMPIYLAAPSTPAHSLAPAPNRLARLTSLYDQTPLVSPPDQPAGKSDSVPVPVPAPTPTPTPTPTSSKNKAFLWPFSK